MTHNGLTLPTLIQGGMGIGVSNWELAAAVSRTGHIGVVSGTALDSLFIRRLQDGDPGGWMRLAMENFPIPDVAEHVLERFFKPEGIREGEPYKMLPMYKKTASVARQQVTILANFVEVFLAKYGHSGPVGINLLTKVQLPNLASLYGAMMAGVDYVMMGAGIPREIPGALDRLANHEPASLRLDVEKPDSGDAEFIKFVPRAHWPEAGAPLQRPRFLPIVSSHTLAQMLVNKSDGRIDGFIVEEPTAGGHNAPPRGKLALNDRGEPIYGVRDEVDLAAMREIGLPFWLAGSKSTHEEYRRAQAEGAVGVQVGTLFAYCDESGVSDRLKQQVIVKSLESGVHVHTDPAASPTGFPFKVVKLPETLSEAEVYEARTRVCDLGYLRVAYRKPDGRLDYRCSAEPVEDFVRKGGKAEDAAGRRCLCNSLMANIGHGQKRKDGTTEKPLLTSGDELRVLNRFLGNRTRYSAQDVIDYLVGDPPNSRVPHEAGHSHEGGNPGTAA